MANRRRFFNTGPSNEQPLMRLLKKYIALNEKRWEQNEKRWEQNEKQWEQNEKRWGIVIKILKEIRDKL